MDAQPARSGIALAGAALALSLVACAGLASFTAHSLVTGRRSITVKGFAEQPITSDLAGWSATVMVRATELRDGYRQLEAARERTESFLGEAGLPADAVSVAAVSVQPLYGQNARGYATNEVELYELRQRFEVESRDVMRVKRVSKEITSLLREGVDVTSHAPTYHYTRLDELKVELLGAAAADARTRADRIAAEGGARAAALVSAAQGVFQITPVTSSEVSSGGMYDTASIRKSVRAVITATFSLEDG